MDSNELRARLRETIMDVEPDAPLFPDTSIYEIDEDQMAYLQSLQLIDEINDVLIEMEEVRMTRVMRNKLIGIRKKITAFMSNAEVVEGL